MDFKTGFELSNGVRIPCIGFGTWQSRDGEGVAAVKSALEAGYRLIDTAAAYGNELSVGAAIRESCVPRDQIFITSKLRNSAHGYDATMEAFEWSTQKLGTDYLDLYLIHWPNPLQFRPIWKDATRGTWRAFEALYRAGRIRAIGVSNFMPHHIEMLMETAAIQPMVNQLKLCPGITQDAAVEYCRARGILVEAYSPLAPAASFLRRRFVKSRPGTARASARSACAGACRWAICRCPSPEIRRAFEKIWMSSIST